MISTKHLVCDLKEIPMTWVFKFYLKLQDDLIGQPVKIKSVFTEMEYGREDNTPSLHLFYRDYVDKDSGEIHEKKYRFKCFSTGKSGDAISLVMNMYKLPSRSEGAFKIISDFNEFILTNKGAVHEFTSELQDFKVRDSYKVVSHIKRKWNVLDEKYWTQFFMDSATLEWLKVCPLKSYRMELEENGEIKALNIDGEHLYGYFRLDSTLYKIYQPKVAKKKFIKVKDYIQGTDQLEYKKPYLVITKSLKDIGVLTKFRLPAEFVAPDSENTMIRLPVITSYKHKYKNICTMFDNDNAGKLAMENYKEKYGLPAAHFEMAKDPSDSVKDNGFIKTRAYTHQLLEKVLT